MPQNLCLLTILCGLLSGFHSYAKPAERPPWSKIVSGLEARPLNVKNRGNGPLFEKLKGSSLGVPFHNQLNRENIKNYLLNGAGLSVGDYDGNGLPDLFLVSQDGPNKLYRQNAPWVFEDVSEAAGIRDIKVWGSGAAFADIDNDGDLDLYVCNKGAYDEIYLNQGNGTFKGSTLGTGNSALRAPSMVAFSDYDLDGDLDFYQTKTRLLGLSELYDGKVQMVKDHDGQWQAHPIYQDDFEVIDDIPRELGAQDSLFRNEGASSTQAFRFLDVTEQSGIKIARDHGLAAVWWDANNDNFPDLYVSNDFHTPDRLYLNNKDGTFRESIEKSLPYTSWSSMGSDFADINNDGYFDYLSTDMSSTTHFKQKTMMGAMLDTAWFLDHLEPRQYMRNAMHLNTGTGAFIEIAFFAGLDSTDWTWAGIFGDLDNDGLEDSFFTNGIERNVQDSDLNLKLAAAKESGASKEELREMFLQSPRFKERNLAFKNTGELKFINVSADWGLDDLSVSHGAIMADLDRDGDLDIIVNNMNDPLGVFRNNGNAEGILISLMGKESNFFGLGARVTVELEDGQILSRILTSSRGYQSGCEPVLHFGLGESKVIKALTVQWPSGQTQRFNSLQSQHHYRITEGTNHLLQPLADTSSQLFSKDPTQLGIDFKHEENLFDDFIEQPLLPNRLSRCGPAFSVGDVNGDLRPDFFLGGAAGFPSQLYLQKNDGSFLAARSALPPSETAYEDVASTLFDFDQDGDLDLYLVSGGASQPAGHPHYQDRLYQNDGEGNFTPTPEGSLPPLRSSGGCVSACDIDLDGDLDLFIGARHLPARYPTAAESALLINDGGRFVQIDSPLTQAGMVTGATWADLDGDQRPDLIVSNEWGPVRTFQNTSEGFIETTLKAGLSELTGWWTCITAADLDLDGDLDLIAGNFGLNTKYRVGSNHPATLFASDFGNQGSLQLVEAKLKDDILLPVRGRSCSTMAMPHLKMRAPSYKDFAQKTLPELYTASALEKAQRLEATTLASMVFINDGSGVFRAQTLPSLSQLSPVMSMAVGDFNKDGMPDLALGQNFYDAQRETGRMNAGLGLILLGQGQGSFKELWPLESGFYERKNNRSLKAVDSNSDGKIDLISINNDQKIGVHLGLE